MWIIVKYATEYYPKGKAPMEASVFGTYTARECGVTQKTYTSPIEADFDLRKLMEFNPSVGYGIVEVEDAEL
jgi:hypothetical protein